MESSRSPRDVMRVAFRLGNKHLPQHSSKYSRRDRCTLPQLFACLAPREFYHLSYRRTEALLKDSKDLCRAAGIDAPPDHNTLCDAFDKLCRIEAFAPMLDELAEAFEEAGLLRLDEQPLAADATYFESRHVSRHFERRRRETSGEDAGNAGEKPGGPTRAATAKGLPKLGIAVACACHLVLSVWAGTGAGGDHPHFETPVYHAWKRAPVRTVVADAGYDSEAAHRLVRLDLNCLSLIPPLVGRPTGKPTTPFRQLMRDTPGGPDEKRAYGQRWRAETVNSMVKRNYGSSLRARTAERRERGMMLKVMVHNFAL